MKLRTLTFSLVITALLLVVVCPTVTAVTSGKALYQNSFSSDPKWVTNCGSYFYWDPGLQMYHFSIEPATGCYAYTPVDNYDGEAFTLEYDLVLNHVDEGTTFRLGFSGDAMNPEMGPNVLTEFTNAKFGQIMWLHLVTPGNKMTEVNSQKGDTVSSGTSAYDGSTVKYELNKTYHITVDYNKAQRVVSMKVNEKTSGGEIWGYYITSAEDLHGMKRIYMGSIGDYSMTNRYATGTIDNVRLTIPAVDTVTTAVTVSTTAAATTRPTAKPTAKTTVEVTTAVLPAATPESPLSGMTAVAALGITGLCCGLFLKRKN
ncbi:hypothetical protein [Methanoregula sp.]|uniref:hypothetical protein n=1 Tax=Methanoregula sp. TaxID=2052170 RepID=UPI00236FFB7F|nr:hypothetical protein [Methanoregula sp.]MDD1685399.1 hypothetical protein [Methanoregula sp.]